MTEKFACPKSRETECLEEIRRITYAETWRLANSADINERRIAASRNWAPKDILEKLSKDPEPDIALEATRSMYPASQRLSSEQAIRLANSQDPRHRIAAAIQDKAPADVLEKLSRDHDLVVTRAVASNPNATPETLDHLSRSKDISVRMTVVHNKATPIEILKRMKEDPERFVGESAEWVEENRLGGHIPIALPTDKSLDYIVEAALLSDANRVDNVVYAAPSFRP